MKHFTSVHDVTDLPALMTKAAAYKATPGSDALLGKGLRVGLLFMNPSMRTRLSTQIAAQNLGMEAIVFNAGSDAWSLELEDGVVMNGSTVEHIRDAAPILGQYFDVLGVRSFPGLKDRNADYEERVLNAFKRHAGIPILSLESATVHPLQSLTDLLTIQEYRGAARPKVVLTWAPHIKPIPQCVANSFSQWMTAWGEADFVIAHPEGLELENSFTRGATIVNNQAAALEGADFVYVKNWSSFQEYGAVHTGGEDWMLTPAHLTATNNAKVMHCLPVRRNVELSDAVLDSPASLVTAQAANRVWAAQVVLSELVNS